ncbi:predicted protein [Micromonas commoda]|uniref:Uncharacterized protein n=1 Tax=Micromonas commoda (strain RCC299 / NOUM17 / CCMP2709) TaxID=296587 RepID=C1E543_MICCC|nr:predicted protein [Micromonas commoda]ACO63232.1 predicted protein [Micromonas commoda]|eukprot:XP_002501974.1 predicted protein [Micromonas commoda]
MRVIVRRSSDNRAVRRSTAPPGRSLSGSTRPHPASTSVAQQGGPGTRHLAFRLLPYTSLEVA